MQTESLPGLIEAEDTISRNDKSVNQIIDFWTL